MSHRSSAAIIHSKRQSVERLPGPQGGTPPLPQPAAMLLPLLLLPLLLSGCGYAAARIPPTGRNDVSVVTTDVVPTAGTFHFVATDRPAAPRYVFASDATRHVVRRKDVSTGEGLGEAFDRAAPPGHVALAQCNATLCGCAPHRLARPPRTLMPSHPTPPLATLLPQPSGIWQTLAGEDGKAGSRDGPIGTSLLNRPTAMCTTPMADLVVVDSAGACVRLVTQDGAREEALALPGGRRSSLHCTSIAAVWTDYPAVQQRGRSAPIAVPQQATSLHPAMQAWSARWPACAAQLGSGTARDSLPYSLIRFRASHAWPTALCWWPTRPTAASGKAGAIRLVGLSAFGACHRRRSQAALCKQIAILHTFANYSLPYPPAPAPHCPPIAGF